MKEHFFLYFQFVSIFPGTFTYFLFVYFFVFHNPQHGSNGQSLVLLLTWIDFFFFRKKKKLYIYIYIYIYINLVYMRDLIKRKYEETMFLKNIRRYGTCNLLQ